MTRKLLYIFTLCTVIFMFSTLYAEEKIKVVASTLDMADFAKQIGGEKADIYAISNGQYDLHFFEPKPSQVMRLNSADMLIVGGLDIDPWVIGLIDASRNSKINYGGIGFVDPSFGVKALDVPTTKITGEMGDVHPYGNPHFWFTPENVEVVVNNICEGLIRVSPENKEYFMTNRDQYKSEVKKKFDELKQKLLPYKGAKVLQYHASWNYFCGYFGLEIVGSVEPKPGIPPSAAYLKDLLQKIKTENVKLVLAEPYYSEKPLNFLRENTGIKILRLPLYLGGNPKCTTYLSNLEYIAGQIAEALTEEKVK